MCVGVLAVGVLLCLGVGRRGLHAASTAHVVFALEGRLVAVLVADAFLFPPENRAHVSKGVSLVDKNQK